MECIFALWFVKAKSKKVKAQGCLFIHERKDVYLCRVKFLLNFGKLNTYSSSSLSSSSSLRLSIFNYL